MSTLQASSPKGPKYLTMGYLRVSRLGLVFMVALLWLGSWTPGALLTTAISSSHGMLAGRLN